MLDFESEIFIWIGSKVPNTVVVTCFKHVADTIRGTNGKGKNRRNKISLSMTNQGFEPEVFKNAFPSWDAFPRAGIDDEEISEEDEDENTSESGSGSNAGASDNEGSSTAAATNVSDANVGVLTEEAKKHLASYISESFWINL